MRLSKIKLSGFKSFVDPTVVSLPSNLVGIVGPNGCGKSNLIDAIRWVMGESSARSLRGETMSDVIFNGAAQRKPVGQASIELVFDNSDGRLGGPWARYAELAIRRLVGRDGQSSYFLNGSRCRRRDIADIFLGTGLGPRSYAIIEQGTISRVVEAKPEELRVFLEEAAGISKYKERRRETETRIRHTRENLERLDDVRSELSRRLQQLQRQARAAEQYRSYRDEERRLRAELLTLRWRDAQGDILDRERILRQQETALESLLAEQRRLEAALESGRIRRTELSDHCNDTQERYYQAGAEISRLEQYLQHQRELRARREDDWRQTLAALTGIEAQLAQDRDQRESWRAARAAAEPELAQTRTAEGDAAAALNAAETALREGQAAWEDFNRRDGEIQRQIDRERTRLEHLERQLTQAERRLERLRNEQTQLAVADLDQERAALRQAEQAVTERLQRDQAHLAGIETELATIREEGQQIESRLRAAQERVQTRRGRLTSLHTLQEAALGRRQGQLRDWLRAHHWDDAPRLAEQLEVEPGWEAAVETALAGWLDAVCVSQLDLAVDGADLPQDGLTLCESPQEGLSTDTAQETPVDALATKLRARWPLAGLLDGVRIVPSIADALQRRAELPTGETLVTPDGVLCGRHWLRLRRGHDDSVLVREREIHQLEATQAEETAALEQLTAQAEQLRVRQHALEQGLRREWQPAVNQGHREQARVQGELKAAQAKWEQSCARRAALAEEQSELDGQYEQDRAQAASARAQLATATQAAEALRSERVARQAERDRRHEVVRQCRAQLERARQTTARQTAALETLRVRLTAVDQALDRLAAQGEQLLARRDQLDAERAADDGAALAAAERELAVHLETRLAVEAELRAVRQDLEAQDSALHEGEQTRVHCERQAEAQRGQIEALRLALGEARVRQQTLCEQLRELGAEPEALLSTLSAVAAESEWLARLEQVERRIQRLGPINLMAIEEFAQLSERKNYLDAQNADLLEALTTLENAMRKIDRETRTRFRDTFERVNAGLGELFPRLFGGGQAHLELTGEDALDTGVAIMAKPPGKRIGSISLLSGGEKALTAVALVFAIFQLNPAPFCLLDEVDAPLDEANVGRFGALVRDMSAQVQFIFVTHNKATMEIAQHLTGVTMQEPGVSRLVAVDVEEAARLAMVS